MALGAVAASLAAAAVVTGSAPGGAPPVARFSLSDAHAAINETVLLRVVRVPRLRDREFRVYLVARGLARTVRSRFDSRLSFVGFVRAKRNARLSFTVPPLAPGSYDLAYWCRGCVSEGKGVGVQASPGFEVTAPTGEACPTTPPNGKRPPRADVPLGTPFHGNGALAVVLRPDGVRLVNSRGGDKMRWWASGAVTGHLTVHYRIYGSPAPPLTARTGDLYGPDSTMAQMSFAPGCWQITGRVNDFSLSFVTQIVLEGG